MIDSFKTILKLQKFVKKIGFDTSHFILAQKIKIRTRETEKEFSGFDSTFAIMKSEKLIKQINVSRFGN